MAERRGTLFLLPMLSPLIPHPGGESLLPQDGDECPHSSIGWMGRDTLLPFTGMEVQDSHMAFTDSPTLWGRSLLKPRMGENPASPLTFCDTTLGVGDMSLGGLGLHVKEKVKVSAPPTQPLPVGEGVVMFYSTVFLQCGVVIVYTLLSGWIVFLFLSPERVAVGSFIFCLFPLTFMGCWLLEPPVWDV